MRIAARLLLISLFAAVVYSQTLRVVPAQQSSSVTVRAASIGSQAGVPNVRVVADRKRVPLGDQVIFTLSPASLIRDPRYQITLFFGDGTRQVMHQPKVTHTYRVSGDYTYSVLVELSKRPTPNPTPLVIPDVQLRVTPPSVRVNQTVRFRVELSRPLPNVSYRIYFGEGTDTGWQSVSEISHVYVTPGTYQVYADIGLRERGSIKQVGGSTRETLTISRADRNPNTNRNDNRGPNKNPNGNSNTRPNGNIESNNSDNGARLNANANSNANNRSNANANVTPQPEATASIIPPAAPTDSSDDWWKYLVFVPLLLLAAYKAGTYFLFPRPTFVPHVDTGKAKASGLGFDYQVDVDPNVDEGAFKINAEGGSLIKTKRMSDE